MPEDLQHLLDTIQQEGVAKAEAESKKILEDARRKADEIVREAESDAQRIRAEAERDAEQFMKQSEIALRQSARDVLIGVSRGIEALFQETVYESVGEALTPEFLEKILTMMADKYFEECLHGELIDIYLNPEDEKKLASFFTSRLREKMQKGVEVHGTPAMRKGFRVSFREEKFYHDMSQEAIAQEVSRFIGPRLKKIVKEVVDKETGGEEPGQEKQED